MTSITGMMGMFVGFVILNWKALDALQTLRYVMLCIAVMMVPLMLLTSSDKSKEFFSRLGGLITGILVGIALPKSINVPGTYEKSAKLVSSFLSLFYFALLFTLLYTVTDF